MLEERLATWDELRDWFTKSCNIGIVCGAISGGLVLQDFESRKDGEEFYSNFEQLCKSTLVDETPHGGIHIWTQTPNPPRRKIRLCEEHPLDLLGEGGYALVPPSEFDGKQYRFISSSREILWIAENPVPVVLNRCKQLGWQVKTVDTVPAKRTEETRFPKRDRIFSEREKVRITDALVPFWVRGQRNQLTIYLLGTFVKRGIAESDATDVIARICDKAADEEKAERLTQVGYHYRVPTPAIARLKGMSGLREVLGGEKIG